MKLPIYHSNNQDFMLMQTQWASAINPILSSSLVNGQAIKGVNLVNGATTINHKLGRMMQGWFLTDQNAAASIYRSQPLNDMTLTLTSNAGCTVSLWVF